MCAGRKKGGGQGVPTPEAIQALLDPDLVPGIYQYCDQWCMYCPQTARCLAYRSLPVEAAAAVADGAPTGLEERMDAALRFTQQLMVAEGRRSPELDALLSDDPEQMRIFQGIDHDPLERLGRRYAVTTSGYLLSRTDFPFDLRRRPGGPTPLEVFAWYHVLLAAKIYRALVGTRAAAAGDPDGLSDAMGSARTALIGIDRSIAALAAMRQDDEDARLESFEQQLERLRGAVEARFPGARAFRRPGLDE